MLIAIDHGNFAIKTVNHSFVAGLAEHTVKPPLTDEVLEYNGKFWTLSGKRLNYMKDKTNDERYFILTLIAIAKELESAGRNTPFEQIQLAVGLPPEHYGVLKNKFSNYFKKDGPINFIYKEKPFSIIIDKVMVFPQAYAAVVPQSSLIVNTPRIFIVDIGGYTTDVLLLKNGKLDFQFCRSLESGVITMNNEIIRKVNSYHDMLLEDEHISDVLCGKDIFLPEDVVETIKGATKQHASNILNQLLCDYYDDPTAVYLREIAKRIDGYEVSQRILVCESLENYLNTLTDFECNLLINGMNEFRNMLLAEELPTDDVDELLLKIIDKSER